MESLYRRNRFPPEIISHAVWLYHANDRSELSKPLPERSEALFMGIWEIS